MHGGTGCTHQHTGTSAAAPLAAWVTANVKFSYVLERIEPLESEQNKLKR